jgi:hypothetical protein
VVFDAAVLDVIRLSDWSGGAASAAGELAPVAQVAGDAQLLEPWLHGRSTHTRHAEDDEAEAPGDGVA